MLITNRGEVITKVESTPYTGETLVDADNSVRFSAPPEYSANIAEYQRKILDGTLDQWTSVMGKQTGTVTLKVDIAPAAAVNTIPAWSKLLQIAGFKVIGWDGGSAVAAGSAVEGISWVPHADNTHIPGTVEIQEIKEGSSADMLVTRMTGCVAVASFMIGTVGEPLQLMLAISGALVSVADRAFAAKLDPTSLSTIVPPAFMGVTTLTVGGVTQDLDSFEINMNSTASEWPDPTNAGGVKGFYLSAHRPTMTLDPTLKLIATEDFWGDWTDETTGALSIVMSSTPALTLSAPACQLITAEFADRNGARVNSKTLLLTSNEGQSPNAVFELLQGAKS